MDWEFNSPNIFFDFYAPDECAGCLIGGLGDRDASRRQLFALKPAHLEDGLSYEILETIPYPNGDPAFVLFGLR